MIKVKTMGGVDIFIDDSGKFHATARGEELTAGSLPAIIKKIGVQSDEKKKIAIPAFVGNSSWRATEPATVTGFKIKNRGKHEKGNLEYLTDKRNYRGEPLTYDAAFHRTPEIEEALKEATREIDEAMQRHKAELKPLTDARDAIIAALVPITAEDFK